MSRRDYHRWEPWMSHVATAACLFLGVALIFADHLLPGLFWGILAVVNAATSRR